MHMLQFSALKLTVWSKCAAVAVLMCRQLSTDGQGRKIKTRNWPKMAIHAKVALAIAVRGGAVTAAAELPQSKMFASKKPRGEQKLQ